jgi:leader peptidase (prepilin peptidase) / N-methyltransferase
VAVLLYVLVGLLGLAVGSFLNVVSYRLPRGESLSRPPSRCPACGAPIRARHNVPVLGWLVLRGRCADCSAPISVRYPAVELATGLLFVAVAARLDRLDLIAALPGYLYFVAIGVVLTVIDLDLKRLPNRIVLPSYPVLGLLLAGAAVADGDGWRLVRAGLAAAALFGFFAGLTFAYPRGMGFGDTKLAGLLGLVLGYLSWAAVLVGAFTGFVLGALVGVVVLASGRGNRKTALPFGPFLIAGTLIAIFAGDTIAGWYPTP